MGVARKTADKWWRRWLTEGLAGLEDRSSRPHRCPHRVGAENSSGHPEQRFARRDRIRRDAARPL
jgi:hypothetical protein